MATRFLKTYILKIKGVAEYLKVTELSIYRLAGAKKIPAFKGVGNWIFLEPISIDGFQPEQQRHQLGVLSLSERLVELHEADTEPGR